MNPSAPRVPRGLLAAILGVLTLALAVPAQARPPRERRPAQPTEAERVLEGGPAAQQGAQAAGAPAARQWHASCSSPYRRPMSMVLGFDEFRDYRPAQLAEPEAVRQLLGTACAGDRVVLAAVGMDVRLLTEPTTLKQPADIDALVQAVASRREPTLYTRINDNLTKLASEEWSRAENKDKQDLLRVLIFFTRHVESRKPSKSYVNDFSWASPPFWLEGMAMVGVMRPLVADKKIEAWDLSVVTTPGFVDRKQLSTGLKPDLTAFIDGARMKERPKEVARMEVKQTAQGPVIIGAPKLPELWPVPDGAILWDDAWTPWAIAAGLGLALVLVLIWALARSAPPRNLGVASSDAKELTLIIHDRLHGTVVGQEKARLEAALRVGPSVSSDVIIPGPYALEIIPGSNGSAPRLRSTNTLPVEVQRASGGRLLHATDAIPVPIRSGDRVHLGGGHELEVRYTT